MKDPRTLRTLKLLTEQSVAAKGISELKALWDREVHRATNRVYTEDEIAYFGDILADGNRLAEVLIDGYDFEIVEQSGHTMLRMSANLERLRQAGVSAELLYAIEYGSTSMIGIGAPLRGVMSVVEARAREIFST